MDKLGYKYSWAFMPNLDNMGIVNLKHAGQIIMTTIYSINMPLQVTLFGTAFHHGDSIRTKIYDKPVNDAKICIKDTRVYICQNNQSGNIANDKLGYQYSWEIRDPKNPGSDNVAFIEHCIPQTNNNYPIY